MLLFLYYSSVKGFVESSSIKYKSESSSINLFDGRLADINVLVNVGCTVF
jgi:hypothetical protein